MNYMGASSKRISSHTVLRKSKPDDWRAIFEPENFLDTREFKIYAAQVEVVIFAAALAAGEEFPGIPTREIHRLLGDHARPEWTLDALTWLSSIEQVGVLPTRYRPRCGAKPRNIPSFFNNREVGGG